MKSITFIALPVFLFLTLPPPVCGGAGVKPPVPFGPVPTERQPAWHQMDFYDFVDYTVNTFTDKEWGYGDEPESVFNPTDFSADQIVQAAKAGGTRGLIVTAIGSRFLWRGETITTDNVRLCIEKSPVCPALSEFALFAEQTQSRR